MMADGWTVEELGARGRGVVATRAFQPGEVVLSDTPYAWALISEQLASRCDCCLQPIEQPLRCGSCRLAHYSSKEHQARAWRAGHREEDAALRSCAPRVPPAAVRLALRCALRHWRAAAAPEKEQGEREEAARRYGELLGLHHHWEALADGAKLEFARMGALAHQLLRATAPAAAEAAGPRDLALLVARFACNSHTISDDELQPLAVGIFPLGAMVNHDCSPNTVHAFSGSRMLFRAVRRIEAREEVTTAYTELAATRWERRRELWRHHQFDIDAPPAAEEGPEGSEPAAQPEPATAEASPQGAGAAASGAGLQAALQCLPAQQPAAALQLDGAAGAAAELRLYSCQLPPWPHDERDAALTAVVLLEEDGGSPPSGGGSGSSGWGGMWGTLGEGGAAAGGASAAAESFHVSELAGHLANGGVAPGAAAAEGEQPAAAAVVHCWSSQPQGGAQQQQVQLANAYFAALRLQRSLDGMLASGAAPAAARQLQQLLRTLAGQPGGTAGPGAAGAGGAGPRLALGPRHVLRMRLLADLHRAAVAAGDWEAALGAAYALLPLYRQAYPEAWPQVGLLWAAAAKLEHLQARPAKALAAAEEALRVLAVTHGGGGAVVEAVRRVLFEVGQEARFGGGGGTLGRGPGDGSGSDEE